MAGYEPVGQEFESLRAHQKMQALTVNHCKGFFLRLVTFSHILGGNAKDGGKFFLWPPLYKEAIRNDKEIQWYISENYRRLNAGNSRYMHRD